MNSYSQKCSNCGGSGAVKVLVRGSDATYVPTSGGFQVLPGSPSRLERRACFRCAGSGVELVGGHGVISVGMPPPRPESIPAAEEVTILFENRMLRFTKTTWESLSGEMQCRILRDLRAAAEINKLFEGGEKK